MCRSAVCRSVVGRSEVRLLGRPPRQVSSAGTMVLLSSLEDASGGHGKCELCYYYLVWHRYRDGWTIGTLYAAIGESLFGVFVVGYRDFVGVAVLVGRVRGYSRQ